MKSFSASILLLFILVVSCNSQDKLKNTKLDKDTTVFYLIRHAEKDRSDKTNRNPKLLEVGQQRAEKWANHFSDLEFDAVYSTNYNRTKETATPTAKANNLELTLYNPSKFDTAAMKAKHKGKRVLVVGHSNTTPMVVNSLLGESKYEDIADDNNANLYIVTVTKDGATAELKVVE